MELYKASTNLSNDTLKVLQSQRQTAEVKWKLDANTSGKQLIKFTVPYVKKPLLNVLVSVDNGSILDCHHSISKFDAAGFELHILNGDPTNQMEGVITWTTMPLN